MDVPVYKAALFCSTSRVLLLAAASWQLVPTAANRVFQTLRILTDI